jgi:geranylgeranyl reductase family protein
MTDSEVIIVGGGPAGSTCASKLRNKGIETLILDKEEFPRSKPCAGWITPRVLKNLELNAASYPHSITQYDRLLIHYRGQKFTLPTRQYAIRRIEFDHWLLKRAGVPVHTHKVETINKDNGYYILDDTFRCKYLIGAGGTTCPVYRTFFKELNPRMKEFQISALDVEFSAEIRDKRCNLWFSDNNLDGYSWYVPKTDGFVNVGIGSKTQTLQDQGQSINQHWERLTEKLFSLAILTAPPSLPRGYTYYLRNNIRTVQLDNVFIIGDAAGLATKDMGEGISPAIESGILAAEAIINKNSYSITSIHKYSFWDLLFSR